MLQIIKTKNTMIMTPKEKAMKLISKYQNIEFIAKGFDEFGEQNIRNMGYERAKQCALIAVDEILNDYSYMQNVRNANSNQIHAQRVYWQEVKQEIENL
jgi:hypothetical protein